MTPDEFSDAVEQAIEDRYMPAWQIYDLRLLARYARRRNCVWRIDQIILSFAGIPWSGYTVKPQPKGKSKKIIHNPRLF